MDTKPKNVLSYRDMHNVTSQYQNPTMKIISMLEPIAKRLSDNEYYDELALINKISESCYQMLKISMYVSEYRLLTENSATLLKETLNLNSYLDQTLTGLKLMLASVNITLELDITSEPITFQTDESYLSKALFLLIARGCKDVPTGASVTVSLARYGNNAVITISDESNSDCTLDVRAFLDADGVGQIGGEDAMMFPIANAIIKLLGGSIIATKKQDFGSSISVSLPIISDTEIHTTLGSNSRRYLTNRYSDMHVIFSGIFKPTFF